MKPTRFFTVAMAISGLAALIAQPALAKIPSDTTVSIRPPSFNADDNANAGIRVDLQKTRKQYAMDLDRAAYDLNVRYADQLNALLVKAAQDKAYAAVSEINGTLMATTSAINHSEIGKKELRDWLMANDFTWVDDYANGHPRYHFKFYAKAISGDPGVVWVDNYYHHWEAISGDEVRFPTEAKGSYWSLYFYVDRNAKTLSLDEAKTPKEHQDKEILFGNQTKPEKAESQPSATPKLLPVQVPAKDMSLYSSRTALPPQIDDHSNANAEVRADLQKASEQHAADLDRATHDLNVRYADQLNALLVKAAQAKDYNYTAVSEINQTLKETTYAINHCETVKKELRDWLMANDFTWVDDYANGHPRYHFKFFENIISGDPGVVWVHDYYHHWEIVSGDEFRIHNVKHNWWLYFKVNRTAKTVTLDKEKTPKKHQDREIIFGNQTKQEQAQQETTESHPSPTKPPSTPKPTIQK